jgi:hypothetical protein
MLQDFFVEFLKYEILLVAPIVTVLQAGTAGTATGLSITSLFFGTLMAVLQASKSVLEKNIQRKASQKMETFK